LLLVGGPNWRQLVREPFFDVTFVPALQLWYPEDVIRRSVRMYMPRTYERLVEGYDTVYLSYSEPRFFDHGMVAWFSDSVVEGGRGMILQGSGRFFFPWLGTSLVDVSPVEELPGFPGGMGAVWLRVLEPEDALMSSLPWSEIGDHGWFVGAQGVKAKSGALVLADKVPVGSGTATPFLTFWEVGGGRCLSETPVYAVDNKEGNPFTSWEFHGDFVRNKVLYASGRYIPQDIFLLHEVGLALERCHQIIGSLIVMEEFVSGLGADTGPLEVEIDRADGRLGEIERTYLGFEFDESLCMAESLIVGLSGAFELAVVLKDRAMVWIYVIEWAILTGTGVLAGSVVWALMVRRRLYRDVYSTRFSGRVWG